MEKYNVLYIDPPWSYKNKNTGGSMKSGAANQYPTMTIEELCNLPIKNIAEKDSVLFLWAVVPLLPEALLVMSSWGYKYKTALFWWKIMSLGMGYWFRGQVEILLMGVKGKVKAFRCQKRNIFQIKVGKHSEKPEEFRKLIEEATKNMPDRKMIELFARKQVDEWDSIGNDIDGQDIRDILLSENNQTGDK